MPRADPSPHHDTPPPQGRLTVSNTAKTADPQGGPKSSRDSTEARPGAPHDERNALSKDKKTTGSQIHKLGPVLRPDIWSSLLYYFVLKGPKARPPGGSKIKPTCEGVFNRKKRNRNQKTKNPVSKKCVFPSNLTHCCCGMNPQPSLKRPRVRPMALLTPNHPLESLCEPTSSMPSATPP